MTAAASRKLRGSTDSFNTAQFTAGAMVPDQPRQYSESSTLLLNQ
ncbi:hypothetical protein OHA10_24215 [Kribbella sp. NBC_00662]